MLNGPPGDVFCQLSHDNPVVNVCLYSAVKLHVDVATSSLAQMMRGGGKEVGEHEKWGLWERDRGREMMGGGGKVGGA